MHRIFRVIIYIFAAIGFILVVGYFAVKFGITNTKGVIDTQEDYFQKQISSSTAAWINTEEWQVLKEAILRDKNDIEKAAKVAGVPSRMIVMPLVVEQLRLYYSDRELFEKAFAPLKLLGNQSQFSWGVMGIKQETARQIEENEKARGSHLLDFTTKDPDQERFLRLTSNKSRYYSYLYAGLYIKQLENQWEKDGFPISDRPEIIATLFNIGFANSHPNGNPQSGGAEIDINKTAYSFGSLAQSFYDSKELSEFTF